MNCFDCEAILFDLDGVLVNSNLCVEKHWRLWAQQHGLDAEAILKISHGRPTKETMTLMASHLDVEAEARKFSQLELEDLEGVVEVLGAAELIAALPENCWAIVTSCDRRLATKRLHYVGLPIPNVFITADDIVRGKPDPEGYLNAAQKLGMEPKNCVVIEDAIAGVKAAKAAEMKVIALTTTYKALHLTDADVCIDTLTKIRLGKKSDRALQLEV